MNQLRTCLTSASRVLHEAAHIAQKGTPEETAIAINLIKDATSIIDLCIDKKIPIGSPECNGCPHQEKVSPETLRVVGGAKD